MVTLKKHNRSIPPTQHNRSIPPTLPLKNPSYRPSVKKSYTAGVTLPPPLAKGAYTDDVL